MKLIFCRECCDVVRLIQEEKRRCYCGKAWGQYDNDGLNAVYGGETAVAIGFLNDSFTLAVIDRPERGFGRDFKAFVIPKHCSTLKFTEEE